LAIDRRRVGEPVNVLADMVCNDLEYLRGGDSQKWQIDLATWARRKMLQRDASTRSRRRCRCVDGGEKGKERRSTIK
jgi:hypothetical protein